MKIRKATTKDISKLITLIQKADDRPYSWAKERVMKYIHSENKEILIVDDNSKLIGFVGIKKRDFDEKVKKFVNQDLYVKLTWIALLKKYRGNSIGSRLMKSVEKYVNKWNKKGIWLDCKKGKILFYEKNGYSASGYFMKKSKRQYVMKKTI